MTYPGWLAEDRDDASQPLEVCNQWKVGNFSVIKLLHGD